MKRPNREDYDKPYLEKEVSRDKYLVHLEKYVAYRDAKFKELESNQKEFEQILIQYVEEGEQLEHLIKDNPYLSGFHEACNKLLTKYKKLNKNNE